MELEENALLDILENGESGLRLGACKGVDPSHKYHREYCDGRMSLPLMVATLVLGFVTVTVNLGVIIRTVKILRKGHDKPAFFFIGNLALSDFAVGLYVVIAFLLHITNKSDLWRQNTCVAVTACQETIFTIVLISVDKYLYICHGLHYHVIMTRKRVYAALIVSWCLSLLIGALPAMGLHVTWLEACNRCAFAHVISTTFAIIFFISSVAVPLAVVVGLYSVLLVLALKMQKARYGGSYTGRESARNSNFRLSFMSTSKKSRSSTRTTSTSNSTSTSSSKSNRRRIRRKELEIYKAELARQDPGGGGGGGGGGEVKNAAIEGVKLIPGVDGGVVGVVQDTVSPTPPAEVPEEDRDQNIVEEGAEGDKETEIARGTTAKRGTDTGVIVEHRRDLPLPSPLTGTREEVKGAKRGPNNDIQTGTYQDSPTEPLPLPGTLDAKGRRDAMDMEAEETGNDFDFPTEGLPPLTSEEEEEEEEKEEEEEEEGRKGWRSLFHSKYMTQVVTETRDKVLFLKKCRAVKTVLLIIVSFTATYVPFVVGTLVYSAEQKKRPCLLHLLNTLLYCAVVANSLVNPLIYAYGYREFRVQTERFKGIFARRKKQQYT